MPTINISFNELQSLVGKKIERKKLQEIMLLNLKADIEFRNKDDIYVELIDTNRPELWSVEGIIRELRRVLNLKQKKYVVNNSSFSVKSDKKVKKARGEIACAVLKNIKLSSQAIKSIMQLQEKLDIGYGRKRKKTSIGLYNLDLIKFPVYYTTLPPEKIKFVPLGFQRQMSGKDIIENHPKGKEYGEILDGLKEYPVLIDSSKKILGLPPITNSNDLGKIGENTRNILVEVTGTNSDAVLNVLNIVSSALAERGGKIYNVNMHSNGKKKKTPDFASSRHFLDASLVNSMLGMELNSKKIKTLLEKSGYIVLKTSPRFMVEAPFYRKDILHQVDIIEDIAITYGFNKIAPSMPKIPTSGKLLSSTKKHNYMREILVGTGAQEILSYMLCGKSSAEKTGKTKSLVEIQNPISSNYNVIRRNLINNMLDFLAKNKKIEFPQKIFELGPVIYPDSSSENGVKQEEMLCLAVSHTKANFAEIKSLLESLFYHLSTNFKLNHYKHPSFIEGRCGEIIANNKKVGVVGEIHPEILESFGIENPVSLFEINVDEI